MSPEPSGNESDVSRFVRPDGGRRSPYLPAEIENPVTGERIAFDETASDDERLVWEERRPANGDPPPPHYHPETEERFVVREGRLVVELDGTERSVEAGEEVAVPPRTPHRSYTEDEPARFGREVSPPGRWREFLTATFAYSHAVGERSGATGFLQLVLLLRAYPDVVVPARPPRPVQRVLFPVLAAFGRAIGLRTHYPYPRDDSGVRGNRRS